MKENSEKQINVFKKVHEYLKESESKKVDVSLSPLCFMTTWTKTLGYFNILKILRMGKSGYLSYILKDLLSVSKYNDLKIFKSENFTTRNILIVSYCSKNNFENDGTFKDSYFSYSSKNRDYTWLLISLDNYIPDNLKENILIFCKQKKKSLSIIFLIKSLVSIFNDKKISVKNIFHYANSQYIFSKLITSEISKIFKNDKINKVLMNYEGIPFQHGIIKSLKKFNNNLKIICYLHCAGWPVQTDLFYREKSIDTLLVSGEDQKLVMTSYLNWPESKIFSIPSLRFNKKQNNQLSGYLFIPFEIFESEKLLKRFEKFLQNIPKNVLGELTVRTHPLNKNSKKHQNFESSLNNLIKKFDEKITKDKKNISIMFGYATGVSIQAIEEGNIVYHFPYNDIIDVFSEKIWRNIEVTTIDDLVFKYKIKNKDKIFFTNSENNKFEKYAKPFLI